MKRAIAGWMLATALLAMTAAAPCAFGGDKKKDKPKTDAKPADALPEKGRFYENLDLSKFVWPAPPAIPRIRYLNYFYGEKWVAPKQEAKPKASWMEKVAGIATGSQPRDFKPRWQLVVPNGVAVDSKGLAYVADSKVRAIFIVDPETGKLDMIKNGVQARFQWLIGLAIDDTDRLFASDSGMKRVFVFDAQHKLEATISEGLYDPGGLAIDNENRLLYVTDAEQDLVFVFNVDPPYNLIRRIGTPGKAHTLTTPGDFSKPAGVAVDAEGDVYVTDTWNDRVEVFDADGNFIRTWGKPGDGPGYFARPKGIAIDGDGHVWVADTMQNRVQVYSPEGTLLFAFGGSGLFPGQFQGLTGLAADKKNRIMTTEQFPGRLQIFRYVTTAEALAEKTKRDAEAKEKVEAARARNKASASDSSSTPAKQ